MSIIQKSIKLNYPNKKRGSSAQLGLGVNQIPSRTSPMQRNPTLDLGWIVLQY